MIAQVYFYRTAELYVICNILLMSYFALKAPF